MQISTKAFLLGTALALVLFLNNAQAQGVVTLADDDEQEETLNLGLGSDDEIPNTIALEDDDSLIIPPKKDTAAPQPINLAEGPKPINLADGPKPINLADGPKPINLADGPKPINLADDPKPINLGNEPQPINLSDEPRPIGAEIESEPVIADTARQSEPEKKIVQQASPVGVLGGAKFGNIDGTIFEKMSDLEKQTAVLSLELRKEKVQNEIEAVKSQRTKAMEELRAAEEEKARKKAEWEREQVIQVIKEQQRLKELETAYENARQEKLLNDYKNHMLQEKQNWISQNAKLYSDMESIKKDRLALAEKIKNQYKQIDAVSLKAKDDAARAKEAFTQEISDLQTQISLLKSRLEAQEKALEAERQNPFAESANLAAGRDGGESGEGGGEAITPIVAVETLDDLYTVMEIRGQGDELLAKLMNKEGIPFVVRKGSVLQNGQMVDEITSSYVRTDLGGVKDYLYFSGGAFKSTHADNNADEDNESASKQEKKLKAAAEKSSEEAQPAHSAEPRKFSTGNTDASQDEQK